MSKSTAGGSGGGAGRGARATEPYAVANSEWEAVNLGNEVGVPWYDNLTDQERSSVNRYKDPYGFRAINGVLRGTKDINRHGVPIPDNIVQNYATHIPNIDSALDKASLPKNMILYRGTTLGIFDRYQQGKGGDPQEMIGSGLHDFGYTSTTLTGSKAFWGNVFFTIKAPKGTKGQFIDVTRSGKHSGTIFDEQEVLLHRGTRFRITKFLGYRQDGKKNPPHFELEVVGRSRK